jgi:hypothetical protein
MSSCESVEQRNFHCRPQSLWNQENCRWGVAKLGLKRKTPRKLQKYMLTDSFDIQTLVIGTGAVASNIWRRSLFDRNPWKWLVKVNPSFLA